MAVSDAYVFPGCLTPVPTQLFFPKPPTTFLTCFCRGEGENTPERKVVSTGDRTHNHQVISQTRSPLSYPCRARKVQRAPSYQSRVSGRIKIPPSGSEKGHPRVNSVKLFQNFTGSFREEEFLRLSLCPYTYSAQTPPPTFPPEPFFFTDQIIANTFSKGSPKDQFC